MLAYSPTVYMNPINFDLRKTHWMVWKGSHNMQTEAKYKNNFILLHFIRKITKAELENDCAMPHRDLWIFLDKQIRMHTGFRFAFVFFLLIRIEHFFRVFLGDFFKWFFFTSDSIFSLCFCWVFYFFGFSRKSACVTMSCNELVTLSRYHRFVLVFFVHFKINVKYILS